MFGHLKYIALTIKHVLFMFSLAVTHKTEMQGMSVQGYYTRLIELMLYIPAANMHPQAIYMNVSKIEDILLHWMGSFNAFQCEIQFLLLPWWPFHLDIFTKICTAGTTGAHLSGYLSNR